MIDVEAVTRPLSADAPCGPDLDAEGDLAYMNLMARVEGDLPASFFAFDRTATDIPADLKLLARVLDLSLDVRPVVALAKLSILNRDLDGFAGWLATLKAMLSHHWADVHPAAASGQLALRGAVLQTLDDLPTVILPLQYAPLFTSRRAGTISFRSHLVAIGEVARREGEPELDPGVVEQALQSAESADLVALRDCLASLAESVAGLGRTWVTEAGLDDAPGLERLTKLTRRMLAFIEGEVLRRDPTAAAGEPGPSDAGSPSDARPAPLTSPIGARIRTARQAAEGLAAAAAYLLAAEPSSPALMLVNQAQQLVGRSFLEIMQVVMPDVVDDARITIGAEPQFAFRLERLPAAAYGDEAGDGSEADVDPDAQDAPIAVQSRREVQTLLDEVAAFYKVAEPSNPIPLLCERARSFCNLDFLSLVRDMLPRDR